MKSTTRWTLGIGLALILLLACSPAAPAPTASAPAAPKPTAPAEAGRPATGSAATPATAAGNPAASPAAGAPGQAEWGRLKEEAKREGRVVVSGPGFPGLRNGLVEGFERAHSIPVEYVGLAGAEVITRVDREARAGRPTIDVNMGGFTGCWTMAERDQIEDVANILIDPAVTNP